MLYCILSVLVVTFMLGSSHIIGRVRNIESPRAYVLHFSFTVGDVVNTTCLLHEFESNQQSSPKKDGFYNGDIHENSHLCSSSYGPHISPSLASLLPPNRAGCRSLNDSMNPSNYQAGCALEGDDDIFTSQILKFRATRGWWGVHMGHKPDSPLSSADEYYSAKGSFPTSSPRSNTSCADSLWESLHSVSGVIIDESCATALPDACAGRGANVCFSRSSDADTDLDARSNYPIGLWELTGLMRQEPRNNNGIFTVQQNRSVDLQLPSGERLCSQSTLTYIPASIAQLTPKIAHKFLSAFFPSEHSTSDKNLVHIVDAALAAAGQVDSVPFSTLQFVVESDSGRSSESNPGGRLYKSVVTEKKIEMKLSLTLALRKRATILPEWWSLVRNLNKSEEWEHSRIQSPGSSDDVCSSKDCDCLAQESPTPAVSVSRNISAAVNGQVTLSLEVKVRESGEEDALGTLLDITVLEVFPHFLQPLLHTHKLRIVSSRNEDVSSAVSMCNSIDAQSESSIHPSASSCIAWKIPIVNRTTRGETTNVYRAEVIAKVLHPSREQHPADPARGREVPPATVMVTSLTDSCALGVSDGSGARKPVPPLTVSTLQTPSVLVRTPTPDFSMPFNVLTLGSTVLAFLAGLTINSVFHRHIIGENV